MGMNPEGLESFLEMDFEKRALYEVFDTICKELRPLEEAAFKAKHFNTDLVPTLRKYSELGVFGFPISPAYGGAGLDLLTSMLLMQRIAEEGFALSTFFSGHISIGQKTLEKWGTEEQKQVYLPKTTSGEWIMAFALTEPDAGSDPMSLTTSYEKTETGYVLNGSKIWITNGTIADLLTVYARNKKTGKISSFLVEKTFPGFTAEKEKDKEFLITSDTAVLTFEGCEVPQANLLGPEGKGPAVFLSTLDYGRLGKSACSVGVMLDCLKIAVDYTRERHQFGKAIAKHQLVQEHLAEMQTALDASKSLAYYALLERMKHDAHPDDQTQRTRSSMVTSEAKKFCTEKANECAQRTVQLLASSGISGRAAMHYMDTKVPMIYEGTSEIQKLKIAADILGPEFSAFR